MHLTASSLLLLLSFPSAALALKCNICGPGTSNFIREPTGVVTITWDGIPYKQNCQKWQDSKLVPESWCAENILDYTTDICKCQRPDGVLLKDLIPPTVSPAPSMGGWQPSLSNPDEIPDSGKPANGENSGGVLMFGFSWAVGAITAFLGVAV